MSDQEFSGIVLVSAYGLMLLGAIRVFGLRRVLWAFLVIVVLAGSVALRTLGALTSRRY